jgi:uncharacterized membrane protein
MDPNQQYGQPPSGAPPNYGQAPYGQQASGGQAPPPMAQAAPSRWGPTSIGMDPNLAAGLSYLIPILGLVLFFVEKTNRFLRFHSAQVILLAVGGCALGIVWMVLGTSAAVVASSSYTAELAVSGVFSCVFGLAYLGLVGLWLWGMISAFTGKYTKLPIIGDIAERWAGGPPVPAY